MHFIFLTKIPLEPTILTNIKVQRTKCAIDRACDKECIDVFFRGQELILNGFPVFPPADGLPALSFSISSLTLIGMLAVITYTVSWALRQVVNVVSSSFRLH